MATVMTQEEVPRSLHESAAHIVQKEAWEADLAAFEQLKVDDEDKLRRVRWDAYIVTLMYTTLQGAIITTVSDPTPLTCALWWCPALLSAAVYVVTLVVIADRRKGFRDLVQCIKQTDLMISALVECLDLEQKRGSAPDLDTVYPQSADRRRRSIRCLLYCDVFSAMLFATFCSFFSGWIPIYMLCDHCGPCHAWEFPRRS